MSTSPAAAETKPASPNRWRAYLELLRLPNVFTALSNVLMGFLFVSRSPWDARVLAALAAASCCLYLAGIVLNDVFDLEIDRLERPQRPLPSGRLSHGMARLLGVELLLVGTALGWLASYLTGSAHSGGMATGLAAAVLLYDGWAKTTPLGPPAMGLCRGLNVLLGMSAAPAAWNESQYCIAGGVGLYIVGVTWFARSEATVSQRGTLIGGLATMIAGLTLVALFPLGAGAPVVRLAPLSTWWALWGFLMLSNLWRCVPALADPGPERVQQAIRRCLMALIMYDAAIVLALHGGVWAAAVLALLAPTLWLGRWIYST